MKKLKIMLAEMFLLLISSHSLAMVVYDPAVFFQTLLTADNTLSQLHSIRDQLTIMKQQGLTLNDSQYKWSNAQPLINQLGGIVKQNNALAYSSQNMDQQFKKTYPGYQAPQDYGQQYQKITSTTLATLNNVLQSVGTNANDFENENSRMAFLQKQEQSTDNQLRAIQAASQIASEEVSQLQLLRQVMMAQTNAQTAYYAGQVQNEAGARAELAKVIQNGSKEAPPIGSSGHKIVLPNYYSVQ